MQESTPKQTLFSLNGYLILKWCESNIELIRDTFFPNLRKSNTNLSKNAIYIYYLLYIRYHLGGSSSISIDSLIYLTKASERALKQNILIELINMGYLHHFGRDISLTVNGAKTFLDIVDLAYKDLFLNHNEYLY